MQHSGKGGRVPPELAWWQVADFVGGYLGYLALIENGRDYDDVLLIMAATADAQQVIRLSGG